MQFPVTNDGIRAALDWLLSQADEFAIPRASAHRMAVIVDEYCSNLIRHDPSVTSDTRFSLELQPAGNGGLLTIRDSARPFDPTDFRPAQPRRIGGQGILLMNGLATSLNYRSDGEQNILEAEVRAEKAD